MSVIKILETFFTIINMSFYEFKYTKTFQNVYVLITATQQQHIYIHAFAALFPTFHI